MKHDQDKEAERERAEQERTAEKERLEQERQEQERSEQERLEQERLEKERLEQERVERTQRDEQEREERKKVDLDYCLVLFSHECAILYITMFFTRIHYDSSLLQKVEMIRNKMKNGDSSPPKVHV